MRRTQLDLAIVGAGLAGLAAARRARELGLDVEVFEASEAVGGRVRSDQVGEFICDRGFQLINPSYPALARYYRPERFHTLPRGIDLVLGERITTLGDPRTGMRSILGDLSPRTGTTSEKIRFLKYLRAIERGEVSANTTDLSFEEEMLAEGIGSFYARVIGPFAAGVFLNHPSLVSARVARELIHYFLVGKPGIPIGGVGEVAKELAADLTVNLRATVDDLGADHIRIGRRRVKARAFIIATDLPSAQLLAGNLHERRRPLATQMSASTTWYHSVDSLDFPALLRIDGMASGPITNSIAISKIAPEYAPPGKTLISTTVMSAYGQEVSEARVRKHLSHIWKRETESWTLVRKYSIAKSLPLMFPGVDRLMSLELPRPKGGAPRFLAGDFLGLPAQQGAMESGIDAAEQVAAKL